MKLRVLAVLALTAPVALPGAAQEPAPAPAPAPPPGVSPETALRHRERLQLTEEQVRRLQTMRQEALAARRAELSAMLELRSRARAGEIPPEELRRQMIDRRRAMRDQMGTRADRAGAVLNQAQRDKIRELRRDAERARRLEGSRGRGEGFGPRGPMRPGARQGPPRGPRGGGIGPGARGPRGRMGPPRMDRRFQPI